MSILCPVCGEPPVCDCRLDAMKRQLECADALAKVAKLIQIQLTNRANEAITNEGFFFYALDGGHKANLTEALANYEKVRNP